jgi:hypothetical protein
MGKWRILLLILCLETTACPGAEGGDIRAASIWVWLGLCWEVD